MNIFLMYLVLLFFVFHQLAVIVHAQDFSIRIIEYKACRGPKRKNCTGVTLKPGNEYTLLSDLDVKQNVIITHGKIIGKSVKGKKELPFQMKKPCDHFFIKQSLQRFLKINSDCLLVKNRYIISVNLKEIIASLNKYIGDYLTGEWVYSTLFYGTDCNVFCSHLHLKISPIT